MIVKCKVVLVGGPQTPPLPSLIRQGGGFQTTPLTPALWQLGVRLLGGDDNI